jgi:hypothetical protein
MADNGEMPAWLLCEDILTKIKDELILEAIDILHEEINQRRINIEGYVPILPEKTEEVERDLFLLNNLLSRREEIKEQYRRYSQERQKKDPEQVMRMEALNKFLMSIDAITFLMDTSHVFEMWADETGKYSRIRDPSELLSTSASNEERIAALRFILSSSKFTENEPLGDEEFAILRQALDSAEKIGNAS